MVDRPDILNVISEYLVIDCLIFFFSLFLTFFEKRFFKNVFEKHYNDVSERNKYICFFGISRAVHHGPRTQYRSNRTEYRID